MKCRVCLNYLLDVPDEEIDASAYKKIVDDAKWLVDNYSHEAYLSFVERLDDDDVLHDE